MCTSPARARKTHPPLRPITSAPPKTAKWRPTRYQPEEYKPGVQFQTDEELARLAGDIASTIFHPVGTTRITAAWAPTASARCSAC